MYSIIKDKIQLLKEMDEDHLRAYEERTKEPYKVFCPAHGKVLAFGKKYIQEQCEAINESR